MASNHDPYGRAPFEHPAVDAVESLTDDSRTWLTYHKQIAKVAEQYGLPAVMRWVPRNVRKCHGLEISANVCPASKSCRFRSRYDSRPSYVRHHRCSCVGKGVSSRKSYRQRKDTRTGGHWRPQMTPFSINENIPRTHKSSFFDNASLFDASDTA
jgi:hypothetical protein